MMRVALEIAGRVFCGADVRARAGTVDGAIRTGAEAFLTLLKRSLLPEWLPTASNRRVRRSIRDLDAIVYELIAARRAAGGEGDDVLSLLVMGRDENGAPLSDREVRDEAITLLLAGHETTALALAWLWHVLANHAEVQERVAAEVAAVLGGRLPTAADRNRLPYVRQVVQESMRLYPPSWGLARRAVADCAIGGYRIPAGTAVMVSQWLAHRDPRSFPRADAFDPEPWAHGGGAPAVGCAYFPFGAGPRSCIGGGFAMAEAVLIVATVVQRFRLLPAPGHEVLLHPSFTLRPKDGVPLVVRRR
jgi:cytochrome P450